MKTYLTDKAKFLKNLAIFLGGIGFGSGLSIIGLISLAVGFTLDLVLTIALSKGETTPRQSNDILRGSW